MTDGLVARVAAKSSRSPNLPTADAVLRGSCIRGRHRLVPSGASVLRRGRRRGRVHTAGLRVGGDRFRSTRNLTLGGVAELSFGTASAANRRDSVMSSCSRYGRSARICSSVSLSANMETTVATGTRRPRMHGIPPMTAGSTVIRSKAITKAYPRGCRNPVTAGAEAGSKLPCEMSQHVDTDWTQTPSKPADESDRPGRQHRGSPCHGVTGGMERDLIRGAEQLEGLVSARTWGFESLSAHHL